MSDETLATPPTATEPREEAFSCTSWHELREPLKPLGRQACVVVALRAAKRVEVLVRLRDVALEAVATGFDVPHRVWYGRTAGAAWASAADVVLAATGGRAASTAITACIDAANAADGPPADLHRLVALDVSGARQVSEAAKAGGMPLAGWDDPRLGPLWPVGEPEWHKKAEQELRELKDKLVNRPDPFAPPVPAEKLAHFADSKFLNEKLRGGELAEYGGNYVLAFDKRIIAHGPELGVIRKQKAAELNVPEYRLAALFVHS